VGTVHQLPIRWALPTYFAFENAGSRWIGSTSKISLWHSISGLRDSQGAGAVYRGWLGGTVPISCLATGSKERSRQLLHHSQPVPARASWFCFKRLWAIAPAHAVSSSENCLPSQIRQSTLSLAGEDILHHSSAVDEGSCQYCWGSCTLVRGRVPLVVPNELASLHPLRCAIERGHVEASHFRPAPLSSAKPSLNWPLVADISCSRSLKTWTKLPPAARTVAIVVVARRTSTAIAQSGTLSVGVSSCVINEELHALAPAFSRVLQSDIIAVSAKAGGLYRLLL